jgi:hypothetical protein
MIVSEFYSFMRKRELIRLRRQAGQARELWTDDPILQTYKFTNVKRIHDWTTQKLLANFYQTDGNHLEDSPSELLINCTMARFFGLADTVLEIGWIDDWDKSHDSEHIRAVVRERYRRREPVFTGAYIVPNCGDVRPKHEIVIDVISDVASWASTEWWHQNLPWKQLIGALCTIKGMGSFMAKEVVLDFIAASGWTPPDWETWTPIGPGARRGAARVEGYGALHRPLSEKKALEIALALYDERSTLWPFGTHDYGFTWVPLELSDIQFQLCEFDKYLRAVRGEGRPKAKFVPRH